MYRILCYNGILKKKKTKRHILCAAEMYTAHFLLELQGRLYFRLFFWHFFRSLFYASPMPKKKKIRKKTKVQLNIVVCLIIFENLVVLV